jgi:hypothetical protein
MATVAFNDRDHHSSQLDRAHRCDGGEYHGIGVVLVVRRDDVWIGEPGRHVERKPFSRAGKNSDARRVIVVQGLSVIPSGTPMCGTAGTDRHSCRRCPDAYRSRR